MIIDNVFKCRWRILRSFGCDGSENVVLFYLIFIFFFFFQAEDGIRDKLVTGVQTCALPILPTISPTSRDPSTRPMSANTPTGSTRRSRWWASISSLRPKSASSPCASARRPRSEERRVGKECRCRWSPEHEEKKEIKKMNYGS